MVLSLMVNQKMMLTSVRFTLICIAISFTTSCNLNPPIKDNLPPIPQLYTQFKAVDLSQPWQLINLQDPGYIVIRDGQACAQSDTSGREEAVAVSVSESLPPFV